MNSIDIDIKHQAMDISMWIARMFFKDYMLKREEVRTLLDNPDVQKGIYEIATIITKEIRLMGYDY